VVVDFQQISCAAQYPINDLKFSSSSGVSDRVLPGAGSITAVVFGVVLASATAGARSVTITATHNTVARLRLAVESVLRLRKLKWKLICDFSFGLEVGLAFPDCASPSRFLPGFCQVLV
jgi:hypothetical protein